MNCSILEVNNLSVQLSGKKVLDGITFQMQQGDCIAIIGAMGSGKTTLVKALTGNLFHSGIVEFSNALEIHSIEVITRQHRFANLSNVSQFYYQQRFNASDAEDSITIYESLIGIDSDINSIQRITQLVDIEQLLHAKLIQLSNGEHKRFQIAKALLKKSKWIIFDAPYIGLDVASRKNLNIIIDTLVEEGKHVILFSDAQELPLKVNRIGLLSNRTINHWYTLEQFINIKNNILDHTDYFNTIEIGNLKSAFQYESHETIFQCKDLNIQYGEKKILSNISWHIKKGESWQLKGHNGSGKSTLLSVFNGDNPQAYANDIILFDKKKGTGESIWTIKNKIGFVSPELHHYFDANNTVEEVVASGLFDTIGLFRKLSAFQWDIVSNWLRQIGIDALSKRYFNTLSDGEQRLTLIARALVKLPPVIVLDEPAQGLDKHLSLLFKTFIEKLVVAHGLTLIYVSHYDEEVPNCVTQVLSLQEGKMVRLQ